MDADDVRASTASAYDQIVGDFVHRNREVSAEFAEFRASFAASRSSRPTSGRYRCGFAR